MKLVLVAGLLILGGITCLSSPDSIVAGIVCILIGALMIIYKIFSSNSKNAYSNSSSSSDYSSQETSREVDEALAYHDALTTAQPYIRKASEYTEKIRALKISASPRKDPCSHQVDELISLCDEAMSYYNVTRAACRRLNEIQAKETSSFNESTLCLFPAAECLINIYLLRKQFVLADGVIASLVSLNLKGTVNANKIEKFKKQVQVERIRATQYPYSTDACIAEINDRIASSGIDVFYPSKSKKFNRSHFQDFCKYYGLKDDEAYAYNSAINMNGNLVKTKSYTYSPCTIDYILDKLYSDPHAIEKIRAELKPDE